MRIVFIFISKTRITISVGIAISWKTNKCVISFVIYLNICIKYINSCLNVCVLHKLPPSTNYITCCHLELFYQYSPVVDLVLTSDNFLFSPPYSPPHLFPCSFSYLKLSCGAIFTCIHVHSPSLNWQIPL